MKIKYIKKSIHFLVYKKYKLKTLCYEDYCNSELTDDIYFKISKIMKKKIYFSFYYNNIKENLNKSPLIYLGYSKNNKKVNNISTTRKVLITDFGGNKVLEIKPTYLLIINNFKKTITIIGNDKNKKKGILKLIKIAKAIKLKKESKKRFFIKNIKTGKKIKKEYSKKFLKIKKEISKGNIMQIQIGKKKTLRTNIETNILFRKIKKKNNECNNIIINNTKKEIIMFSPEYLFKTKNNNRKILTYPIAGTIERGSDIITDIFKEYKLKNDKKEITEHTMLVDLSRNDLNKISLPRKTNVIDIFKIKKLRYVQHIFSKIVTKTKPKIKIKEIIRKLNPAGTLSGAPKNKAIEYIKKLDRRKIYGGIITLNKINKKKKKRTDSIIIIRSCLKEKKYIFTRAASGIVKESKIKKEWKELNDKLRIFLKK